VSGLLKIAVLPGDDGNDSNVDVRGSSIRMSMRIVSECPWFPD
jgi:hypothetical protein